MLPELFVYYYEKKHTQKELAVLFVRVKGFITIVNPSVVCFRMYLKVFAHHHLSITSHKDNKVRSVHEFGKAV